MVRAARSTLAVDYKKPTNEVAIGVTLTEPPNGIIANLLSIEGKPEIALSVNGAGPVARPHDDDDARRRRHARAVGDRDDPAAGRGSCDRRRPPRPDRDADHRAYRPFFGAETVA